MRLTSQQQDSIRDEIKRTFGDEAEVRLFGSRTDDSKRGGDIDLLVSSRKRLTNMLDKKLTAITRIQRRIGDQKIDLIISTAPTRDERAVVKEALKSGVRL